MTITPYIPQSFWSSVPTGIWSGAQGLPVLPFVPGLSPIVTKAPLWSTEVIRTASGRERRTSYWPYPLWQFELSYETVRHKPTNDELAVLWEFFNVQKGQFAPWLFVDPSDCQILSTAPSLFAIGDGHTQTFQLARTMRSFLEPVYDFFQPTVLINGTPNSGYITSPNGVISFGAPPANGALLSWYGYYYFGCRFDQDDMGFEEIANLFWTGKSVKFTSLRA